MTDEVDAFVDDIVHNSVSSVSLRQSVSRDRNLSCSWVIVYICVVMRIATAYGTVLKAFGRHEDQA